MITTSVILVQGEPFENKGLFLRGKLEDGGFAAPEELSTVLFARHEPSFFGSMLSTLAISGLDMLLLPAQFAIGYLADPQPNRFAALEWEPKLLLLQELARLYRLALMEGRFMPSHAKLAAGAFGWTLLLREDEQERFELLLDQAKREGMPRLEACFDHFVRAWLENDPALRSAWLNIAAKHEAFASVIVGSSLCIISNDHLSIS